MLKTQSIYSKWTAPANERRASLSTGMYVSYQTIICHLFAYVQVVASQRLA
jgi:hypothetical protein